MYHAFDLSKISKENRLNDFLLFIPPHINAICNKTTSCISVYVQRRNTKKTIKQLSGTWSQSTPMCFPYCNTPDATNQHFNKAE